MRNLFFKDFWWKLFSFLLAAFIWFTVHKIIEEPQSTSLSIPFRAETYANLQVLVVATAADMHQYHVQPDHVSVTVSGPAEVLEDLKDGEIRPTVDLSKFDATGSTPQPVDVSVPDGITLVKVSPATVKVIVPTKP